MRDATGEFDDLDAAGDLALSVGEYLAVLLRDDPRQRIVLARQNLQKLEQNAGAAQRRGGGPARERGAGRLDGGIDLARVGERDPSDFFAGCRVEDIAPAPACATTMLTVDVM